MLDLDDLEVETLRLFISHPGIRLKYAEKYSYIFVDEYQDTSPIQAVLLKALTKTLTGSGENRICAIGDPDQAIYGFRGSGGPDVTPCRQRASMAGSLYCRL